MTLIITKPQKNEYQKKLIINMLTSNIKFKNFNIKKKKYKNNFFKEKWFKEIKLLESLKKSKIINKSYSKFKILANGNLNLKIDIEADFSSVSAKEKIEKLGGTIKIKNLK